MRTTPLETLLYKSENDCGAGVADELDAASAEDDGLAVTVTVDAADKGTAGLGDALEEADAALSAGRCRMAHTPPAATAIKSTTTAATATAARLVRRDASG